MKKRIAVFMLAAAMIFTEAQAFAAGAGTGRYYVDADGDGICDNRQTDGVTGPSVRSAYEDMVTLLTGSDAGGSTDDAE